MGLAKKKRVMTASDVDQRKTWKDKKLLAIRLRMFEWPRGAYIQFLYLQVIIVELESLALFTYNKNFIFKYNWLWNFDEKTAKTLR